MTNRKSQTLSSLHGSQWQTHIRTKWQNDQRVPLLNRSLRGAHWWTYLVLGSIRWSRCIFPSTKGKWKLAVSAVQGGKREGPGKKNGFSSCKERALNSPLGDSSEKQWAHCSQTGTVLVTALLGKPGEPDLLRAPKT